MKPFVIVGAVLFSVILIIPTMLVLFFQGNAASESTMISYEEKSEVTEMRQPENLSVPVYRTSVSEVENVFFEDYIIGVVASEMPASFSLEALKAQALVARTYLIHHILNPVEVPKEGIVYDTVTHQVFRNEEELRELWGSDFNGNIKKIREAVQATRGQIITYDGKPISASFFSTSNGYTENSEDYWITELPYLRSVESPWDTASPRFEDEKVISVAEFEQALGVKVGSGEVGEILARTEGGRVASVKIGDKTFTGREIRDNRLLNLSSSDFTLEREGDTIIIRTKGWGHGVGMSQYGANGMALEGKTYEQIIKHYYQGVEISPIDTYISHINTVTEPSN